MAKQRSLLTRYMYAVSLLESFSFVFPTFAVSISVSSTSFAWPISEGQRRMEKKQGTFFNEVFFFFFFAQMSSDAQ